MIKSDAKRNRRLRKKLFSGEFAVQGFAFDCKLNHQNDEQFFAFLDQLIDFTEQHQLFFGASGGYDSYFEGFVMSEVRYQSATEQDRELVSAWLKARSDVTDLNVATLRDAYHGW